ncbi:SDR family oxidoreductase [Agitococcus lubricus]|nr:SDR family oxidoreductase [Agitococcus lubricus]
MPCIFITGAAAGIGAETARLFAQNGWFVGLFDIDETGLHKLQQELGQHVCMTGQLNVADEAQWQKALTAFFSKTGRLDVLLNNAGILASGKCTEIPLKRLHQLIDVNVKGVLNGCYLAYPYLKQTANARIINLCSASALYGQPSLAVYSATKFAVRGLTEALELEWAGDGIRVMDVLPLFVQTSMVTNMDANSIKNMGVSLTAIDVAQTIWQAANYQKRLAKVHWTVGFPTRGFYALSGAAPDFISRTINQFISRKG